MVYGFEPSWLRDASRYVVGAIAAAMLLVAMNGQMLGLSRLSYSLATNRQIPSAVGPPARSAAERPTSRSRWRR